MENHKVVDVKELMEAAKELHIHYIEYGGVDMARLHILFAALTTMEEESECACPDCKKKIWINSIEDAVIGWAQDYCTCST